MSFSSHALLVLLFPPVLTLGLCLWLRTPWKLVALLYLFIPLVASAAMLIVFPERDYSVLSFSFVRAVLGIYIVALFLLGFLSPLFGALARFLVLTALRKFSPRRWWLFAGGTVAGATFGAALLAALAATNKYGPPGDFYHARIILLFAGAMSGGVSGLFVAAYSCPTQDEKTPAGRTPARLSPVS